MALTRVCKTCKTEKPLEDFPVDKRRSYRRFQCRVCRNKAFDNYQREHRDEIQTYQAGYRKEKGEARLAVSRASREKRIEANRRIVEVTKAVACMDCRQSFLTCAMDFDHVRGTKEGNIATMVGNAVRESKLLAEIAKCDVVCSNCHRVRTFKRRLAIKEAA